MNTLERFYNWSSYYALAVIELGQAVQARVSPAPPAHTEAVADAPTQR